jgi:hypothetical protein
MNNQESCPLKCNPSLFKIKIKNINGIIDDIETKMSNQTEYPSKSIADNFVDKILQINIDNIEECPIIQLFCENNSILRNKIEKIQTEIKNRNIIHYTNTPSGIAFSIILKLNEIKSAKDINDDLKKSLKGKMNELKESKGKNLLGIALKPKLTRSTSLNSASFGLRMSDNQIKNRRQMNKLGINYNNNGKPIIGGKKKSRKVKKSKNKKTKRKQTKKVKKTKGKKTGKK